MTNTSYPFSIISKGWVWCCSVEGLYREIFHNSPLVGCCNNTLCGKWSMQGIKYVSRRAATKAALKTAANYYLQLVVLAFTSSK